MQASPARAEEGRLVSGGGGAWTRVWNRMWNGGLKGRLKGGAASASPPAARGREGRSEGTGWPGCTRPGGPWLWWGWGRRDFKALVRWSEEWGERPYLLHPCSVAAVSADTRGQACFPLPQHPPKLMPRSRCVCLPQEVSLGSVWPWHCFGDGSHTVWASE